MSIQHLDLDFEGKGLHGGIRAVLRLGGGHAGCAEDGRRCQAGGRFALKLVRHVVRRRAGNVRVDRQRFCLIFLPRRRREGQRVLPGNQHRRFALHVVPALMCRQAQVNVPVHGLKKLLRGVVQALDTRTLVARVLAIGVVHVLDSTTSMR